jgi:hypothetical protein
MLEIALRSVGHDQIRVSKLLTPTTCGPAPIANSISVTAGTSDTMREGRDTPAGRAA